MLHFDPSEIANWADLPDANHQLPELIRRLILATVPQLSRLDIPSGSAVWQEGWDGLLTATTGNAWVPDGASAWEFGCENRPTSKANKDYRKRTNSPQEERSMAGGLGRSAYRDDGERLGARWCLSLGIRLREQTHIQSKQGLPQADQFPARRR